MAHYLLADAYLQQHEYEKARQQADIAIDRSKGAGNSARLVLGQALANLGKNEEAIAALETFLHQSSENTQAAQVRELIAQIKARAAAPAGAVSASVITRLVESEVDDTQLRLSIKTWEPRALAGL